MKIFILEDDPNRIEAFKGVIGDKHQLTVAKWLSGVDGADEVFNPPYDLMLLDHDLGGLVYLESEGIYETGFKFVKSLGQYNPEKHGEPKVIIHSWNPDGAKAMGNLLYKNGWRAVLTPFSSDLLKWLRQL